MCYRTTTKMLSLAKVSVMTVISRLGNLSTYRWTVEHSHGKQLDKEERAFPVPLEQTSFSLYGNLVSGQRDRLPLKDEAVGINEAEDTLSPRASI